ncbi:hypothetical protein ACRALDRAFT_1078881 [Sodiomyces alcalophilus JCM 7366]|uniref:uncharacterized protein n=1 Tax=Sodiomyces alcalophilus JCM 7366 TaxID=591952 RepID=UPI0039B52671
MAQPPVSGRGIIYVNSGIERTDVLDEEKFMNWYDNDHIPEILETSGVSSAWRFKDVEAGKVEKPYLAMYPLEDIGFTQTEEFKKIRVHSDLIPGGASIYDLANFDVRVYNLTQVFDPTKKGKGHTKTIISAQIEPGPEISAEEFDRWYREEHLEQLSKGKGFLRATRYEIAYARSNAQSRVLKGLATTSEPPPKPPTYLALHEFSTEDVSVEQLKEIGDSPWSRKILSTCKAIETPVFKIVRTFGEGDFFHGVEV